jgi:xylulokinase
LNATKVTDAFGRLLGVERDEFDELALKAPPGAGGVVLLPYLDGERTPNRPDATGVLTGVRSDVTQAQVARAAVEGVICGLLDDLSALQRAGVDVGGGRVMLVGGGAKSAAHRRVLADLMQRPVTLPAQREHVAAGACVQAAAVLRGCPPEEIAESWWGNDSEIVEPDERVDTASVRSAYAALRGPGHA